MYSFKRKRYKRPFPLNNEIKEEIKKRVGNWYENKITELDRSEIADIIYSANRSLQRSSR